MGPCEEDRARGETLAPPRRIKSVAYVHRAGLQVLPIKLDLGGAHKFTGAGADAKGMYRTAGFPLIHAAPDVLPDRLPSSNAAAEPADKLGILPCQVGLDVLQAKRGQPDNTIG
jgi:hypothetical protein